MLSIPKMSQQIKQIEQIFECAKNDLRESANIGVQQPLNHFHLWWRA